MFGFLGSLLNFFSNLGSTAITNGTNQKMNEENIALQRETNAQQVALQRETNTINQNAPTTQFTQLRSLGASRQAALAALGAPQAAGSATLTAPQNTHVAQAANIDIRDMFHEFEKGAVLEREDKRADINSKKVAITNAKNQEQRDEEIHQENLKKLRYENAINVLDADERKNLGILYSSITNNSKFSPDMSFADALNLLSDEERTKVNTNSRLLRALRLELQQDLNSSIQSQSASDAHRAADDKHEIDQKTLESLKNNLQLFKDEKNVRDKERLARELNADLDVLLGSEALEARKYMHDLDFYTDDNGEEHMRFSRRMSQRAVRAWNRVADTFGIGVVKDLISAISIIPK